jgi:calcineurin-like phosphoesterase family protein
MNNRKKIFFSSDWHIGHANVLKFDERPFKDLDHMHRVLINNYNATVPEDGICYFLGDIGNNSMLYDILRQLNGTKVLIKGNHDKGINAMYNLGFDVVLESATLQIAGYTVSLSHFPLAGVHREDTTGMRNSTGKEFWHGHDKHSDISVKDFGQLHLAGHIHSPNNGKSLHILGRQFDVGVRANNYIPVSLSTIESWVVKTVKVSNMWVNIPDYPGYKINGFGEIMSFRRYEEGERLRLTKDKDGYLTASLQKDDKVRTNRIHRLVAKTFLTNPNSYEQVKHKNGHKLDNSIENLEWTTHTEN